MLDVLGLALSLLLGQANPSDLVPGLRAPVTFDPRTRAVSGWRAEAAAHLDASPGTRVAILLGRDPAAVSRCVRLNNYWCIKRGGWSGEIAADREGHVAFASAAEGAAVAALLLRRYYVDDRRRSARAIVSRWAPASCGGVAPRGGPASRSPRAAPDGLAVRGIGRTLRARWLAARGRRRTGARASAVPDRLIGAPAPAPTIALGLGGAPLALAASLPAGLAAARPAPAAPPRPVCAADLARLRNYAARAAAGLAPSVEADLGLFDDAGRPTPNLARLMRNMAAVEVGPLGADRGLVAAAILRAAAAVAARPAQVGGARAQVGGAGAPDLGARAPGRPAAARLDQGGRPGPPP